MRGFVVSSPGKAADAAQFVLDALQYDGFGVHGNAERDGQLLPAQSCRRGVGFHVIEHVGEHVKRFGRVRFHRDAQRVLFLVVAEAAPGSGILGENNRPLILVGNGVQSVGACGQRFSFYGNVISESDGGIFIRARAPDLTVGDGLAPDLAPVYRGAVIGDGDVGQADPLRHGAALAGTRNVQLRGLAAVLELRAGVACQRRAA